MPEGSVTLLTVTKSSRRVIEFLIDNINGVFMGNITSPLTDIYQRFYRIFISAEIHH